MSPKRIEIIIGDPTSKCPPQESRLFWGDRSPSTNIYKYAVVLSTTSSSKNTYVLIDVMSDTADIRLQFEELPCMYSLLKTNRKIFVCDWSKNVFIWLMKNICIKVIQYYKIVQVVLYSNLVLQAKSVLRGN